MENKEIGEYLLAIFRIMLGWIMLWSFFDKLFGLGFQTPAGQGFIDGGSPSSFVTYVAGGIFGDFFKSLAGNGVIDIILLLGLLALGVALIAGIASKITTVLMTVFLLVMYCLCVPPLDNPLVDYHIMLIIGLWAVHFLGGYDRLSIHGWWKELSLVKRFPILK